MLDFIAVGPQKTATSWLDHMVRTHPQLHVPTDTKETFYWDRHFHLGREWYDAHFHKSEGQLCGEIAPSYFHQALVRTRLAESKERCKVIVTLRAPAERAISMYHHHVRKGRVSGSFWQAVDAYPEIVDASHYARHIEEWRALVGDDNILIVLHDDIAQRPMLVLQELSRFLNVADFPNTTPADERVYAGRMVRSPGLAGAATRMAAWLRKYRLYKVVNILKFLQINRIYERSGSPTLEPLASDKEQLFALFAEDVRYVEQVVGRDLQQWSSI